MRKSCFFFNMSKRKHLYSSGKVHMYLYLEERTNKIRGKFRHLARQVSGEVFDVPEDNQVIFVYENQLHVGQISFSVANLNLDKLGQCFDTDFFPQITFMFVHQDFQSYGLGRLMLEKSLEIMQKHCPGRSVRLQSAENAVNFFEKCGFRIVSEPIQCFHSGSKLFKTLINMELDLTSQ